MFASWAARAWGLNVLGGNDVAIRLYQSMGFRTRAMQMSLPL